MNIHHCATLLLSLFMGSQSAFADWHQRSESIMGTPVQVELWHSDKLAATAAIDAVMLELRRLDNGLSPYKKGSELYQINHRKEQSTLPITMEMQVLLQRSQHYSELTAGAFDITFASVGEHYDYRQSQQPSPQKTNLLSKAIDYRQLQLNPKTNTLTLDNPNTRIDLGGIAKGYAVDRAINLLSAHGIQHANVSAGGDARVLGDKRGKPWMIGIKHPRQTQGYAAIIPLNNSAISTSGDYERFFIDTDGQRVHHIIDPTNGMPTGAASDALISVSIIGPNGFDTDPLSTSVFVLGRDAGLKLIDRLPEFEAVVIDKNRRLHYSKGLITP